jgi:hypothetical protein
VISGVSGGGTGFVSGGGLGVFTGIASVSDTNGGRDELHAPAADAATASSYRYVDRPSRVFGGTLGRGVDAPGQAPGGGDGGGDGDGRRGSIEYVPASGSHSLWSSVEGGEEGSVSRSSNHRSQSGDRAGGHRHGSGASSNYNNHSSGAPRGRLAYTRSRSGGWDVGGRGDLLLGSDMTDGVVEALPGAIGQG